MGTPNQARHLAGTPAAMGGKWAPEPKSAADFDEIDVDPWGAPDPVPTGLVEVEDPAIEAAAHVDFGDVDALVREARSRSLGMASRWSLDADDLQQEALLQFLEAQAKAGSSDGKPNGRSFPDTEDGRVGYLQVSMRNVATSMATNGAHSANRGAWRELIRRRDQMEQQLGRTLTGSEIDGLAERIRMERPENQRPVVGFQNMRARPQVSVDWSGGDASLPTPADGIRRIVEAQTAVTDDYFPEPGDDPDFAPTSTAGRLAGMIEEGGKANSVAARQQAWNAISELSGAPAARHETIRPEAATSVRRAMSESGGPKEFLRAWNRSEESPQAKAAFFAPFGGDELDDHDRDAIVESMSRFPDRAADLWEGALSYATISRKR